MSKLFISKTSFYLFAWLPLLVMTAVAQPPDTAQMPKVALPQQEKIDLTTPALALRSIGAALNRNDFSQVAQCVVDGKPEAIGVLSVMTDEWKKMRGQMLLSEPRIRVRGDRATANLFVQIKAGVATPDGPPQQLQAERVLFQQIAGEWKVRGNMSFARPPADPAGQAPPAALPEDETGNGLFTIIATMLSNPEAMLKMRGNAERSQCLNNLKQLALAAMMLSQDYNEIFDINLAVKTQAKDANPKLIAPKVTAILKAPWQQALWPYAKALDVFVCPSLGEKFKEQAQNDPALKRQAQDLGVKQVFPPEAYEGYAFNATLEGILLKDIKQPSRTVLIYEGKDGKLDFRHEGMACVSFVDGHVQAVGPDEVKDLIWNPKGNN